MFNQDQLSMLEVEDQQQQLQQLTQAAASCPKHGNGVLKDRNNAISEVSSNHVVNIYKFHVNPMCSEINQVR